MDGVIVCMDLWLLADLFTLAEMRHRHLDLAIDRNDSIHGRNKTSDMGNE